MRAEKLQLLSLRDITIEDGFWNKYTKLVTKEIIPYQWRALNDEVEGAEPSYCISNFKVAAGLQEGTFHGWVFQDSDLAKWIEAVAYSLSYEPNAALEELVDEAVELIGKAQEENGYLDTYFSILTPGKQFCNLKEGHELYVAGHMIEAAVAYYKVTGKDKFLTIMRKTADFICDVFHTKRYENAVPGHEEIELALFKLYEVTGEEKYRDMAKDFVERRGTEPNYLVEESKKPWFVDVWHDPNPYHAPYGQAHKPVREQDTAEGHAVRAVYLYCAMADLAQAYQDESLFAACEKLYENITEKRMYLTGGIGSSGTLERFTTDYDLPNDTNYSESCASIGLALFCRRMAQMTGDAKYVDTMELALMNTVLSGIAMDGKSFFYVNPLEVWPKNCMPATDKNHIKPVRQKWFGCACCPPNIARTLSSLGEYVCFMEKDAVWLNLFTGGTIHATIKEKSVDLHLETNFPWEGKVEIAVDAAEEVRGNIYIRIPAYAKNVSLTVDGAEVENGYTRLTADCAEVENGYARLTADWKSQKILLEFEMPAQFVYANPQVRADAGKVAVVKGPLVYCLEEVDNGENLSSLFVDVTKPITESKDEMLGGTLKLTVQGKRMRAADWCDNHLYGTVPVQFDETEMTLVPYCYWGNRTPGEMAVWMKMLHA